MTRPGAALLAATLGLALAAAWPPRDAAAQEACCFADGLCIDLDAVACAAAGGTAQGPGSDCATTTCAPRRGACCILTPFGATCAELDPLECALRNGGFLGVGTTCVGADCATPRACCRASGACTESAPIACSVAGGAPQPEGTRCADVTCAPTEACCLPGDAACLDLEAADCLAAGGTPQGPGSSCVTRPCPLATVACCSADGTCDDLDLQACLAAGDTSLGTGTSCLADPCPDLLGACCVASPFGTLCRDTDAADCAASGGIFLGTDADCATSGSTCTAPQACCLPDSTCTDLAILACRAAGGAPQGAGTSCAGTSCGTPGLPGWVPSGTPGRPGPPLLLRKAGAAADLALLWSEGCSPDAIDATVHEGAIGSWYSHDALACDTGGALVNAVVTPGAGDRYFLVVPVTATDEGSYGVDSRGAERPTSGRTCLPAQALGCP